MNKKEANKIAYNKHRQDDSFNNKKTEYDKQYYQEHKQSLLKNKKDKYHTDTDYQTRINDRQKQRYLLFNKSGV